MAIVAAFVLSVLALPPVSLPIAGCVFFVPLLFHLDAKHSQPVIGAAAAALVGAAIGVFAYWGTHVEGLLLLGVAVTVLTVLYGMCGYVTARLLACSHSGKHALLYVMLIPGVWATAELLANSLGLPFSFALTVLELAPFSQLGRVGGSAFVSATVIGVQSALYLLYRRLRRREYQSATRITLGLGSALLAMFTHADFTETLLADSPRSDYILIAAQTNLPSDVVTQLGAGDNLRRVLDQHHSINARIADKFGDDQDGGSTVDKQLIVVWPESAKPALETAVSNDLTPVPPRPTLSIQHAYRLLPQGKLNSQVQVRDRRNALLSVGIKRRPIPLIESTLTAAREAIVHRYRQVQFGTLICYEAVFSDGVRELVSEGADWLAVVTNDAYEGPSFLSYMVLGLTRLRAIESGVTIARAANGGLSAIIQPTGQADVIAPMYAVDIVTGQSVLAPEQTTYIRFGRVIEAWLCLSALAAIVVAARARVDRRANHAASRDIRSSAVRITYGPIGLVLFAMVTLTVVQHRVMHLVFNVNSPQPAVNTHSVLPADKRAWVTEAFEYIHRQYGFARSREPVPRSVDDIRRWASAHGLRVESAGVDRLTPRLSHTALGLVDMPGGVPAVIIGRTQSVVRLYSPRNRRYHEFAVGGFEALRRSPILWFLPRSASAMNLSAARWKQRV